MSPQFQSLFGLVGKLLGNPTSFPWSLLPFMIVYILTIALIVWFGLLIYLAVSRSTSLRGLAIGALPVVLGVILSNTEDLFFRGISIPHPLGYLMLYLPMILALLWAIRISLNLEERAPLNRVDQGIAPFKIG